MNESNSCNKHNVALLNAMYENSAVGSDCIERIIPRIESTQLKSTLQKQLDAYEDVNNNVKKQLQHAGHKPSSGHDFMSKTAAHSTALKTMADPSESNVAKIMIKGTNMGIIDLTKAMNNCEQADATVKNQVNSYISSEQEYIEQMKPFL